MIKDRHKDFKEGIEKAIEHYAKYANRGRKKLLLKLGDWVWVYIRK